MRRRSAHCRSGVASWDPSEQANTHHSDHLWLGERAEEKMGRTQRTVMCQAAAICASGQLKSCLSSRSAWKLYFPKRDASTWGWQRVEVETGSELTRELLRRPALQPCRDWGMLRGNRNWNETKRVGNGRETVRIRGTWPQAP